LFEAELVEEEAKDKTKRGSRRRTGTMEKVNQKDDILTAV